MVTMASMGIRHYSVCITSMTVTVMVMESDELSTGKQPEVVMMMWYDGAHQVGICADEDKVKVLCWVDCPVCGVGCDGNHHLLRKQHGSDGRIVG